MGSIPGWRTKITHAVKQLSLCTTTKESLLIYIFLHIYMIFCIYIWSVPASESFPMSQLFAWGGQSTRVSALVSFLPKNTQDWSPLEWTGWISLQSKECSRVFSNATVQKYQFLFKHSTYFMVQFLHPYMTIGKTIVLTRWTFVGKVMSLLFNMQSRLVFLPRSKHLLISWLLIWSLSNTDICPSFPLCKLILPLTGQAMLGSLPKLVIFLSYTTHKS